MSVAHAEPPDFRAETPQSRVGSPLDPLSPQVYAELRALAGRQLRGERAGHTLQATALVHEAWLRLSKDPGYANLRRSDLLIQAIRAVRQVLVDHARRRARLRRGGNLRRVTLTQDLVLGGGPAFDLLDVEDALRRLSELNPRQATVVELRFFGGMSVDEVAEALALAPRTVDGDWKVARAWLARELQGTRPR